jgi:glycosyltransferase involved in cell wall biosynthesis
MPKHTNTIFIVGLFLSEQNKGKIMRTAADQLAELLTKYGYSVITTSVQLNKFIRLIDTLFSIIWNSRKYKIAVVPLYGTLGSYIWETSATLLLKLIGKKVIMVVHGGSIPQRMNNNAKQYLLPLKRADIVACPSNFILTALKAHEVESRLIENLINLKDYHFEMKQSFGPKLLWMRTIEDIYNPEMAVRVAAILVKKYADLRLVMAGYDRGSLPLVKALAEQLNVLDKIEFPGYITNEQKNKYARALDFYICTNKIDNAPVSLIEMMALGLPVVTVNSGGIPYLITDGYNGRMVNLDDDQAMADAIVDIIENPQQGIELLTNGFAFAHRFDETAVIEKWRAAFAELGQH